MQAVDESADFFVGRSGSAPHQRTTETGSQVATQAEGVKQERGEALEIVSSRRNVLLRLRNSLGIAREFVEADGYRLPEVHGAMLFAGGDAHEPVAVAEVFIRKAALLRTKENGGAAACKMFVNVTGGLIEAADGVLQLARAYGGGSHNETAIFDRLRDGLELRSAGKQRSGAHGGTRLAKSQFVGVYHTKMEETEVAHGAGGRANVKGISRGHKNDPQMVGFAVG